MGSSTTPTVYQPMTVAAVLKIVIVTLALSTAIVGGIVSGLRARIPGEQEK